VAEKFAKQKIVESVAGRRQMIHGPLFLNGWLLNSKTKSAVNTVSQKAKQFFDNDDIQIGMGDYITRAIN
jgi:hypothetical protein